MADISIIVPAYNAEKYIERCLESLINQTKKELEFLIINDGSTDKTEEIVKSFKDKRIKYFKNKNQGIGKTRNFGISKVKSKYIMFLDSDDTLDKTTCEKLFNKAESDELDIVICDFYKEFEDGSLVEERNPDFENASLKENPDIISENLCPWAKIYKTDLIVKNNIKFVEDLKYEDAPFVIECLDKAKKIGKINECLNYYLIHSNSETTIRDRRCFDILKIIDIIRNYTKKKSYLTDKIDRLTVRMITNYTIQQRVQENKDIARSFIDEAFAYLEREVPDYKDKKYYEERGILRSSIEKSKTLTKQYCSLYRLFK